MLCSAHLNLSKINGNKMFDLNCHPILLLRFRIALEYFMNLWYIQSAFFSRSLSLVSSQALLFIEKKISIPLVANHDKDSPRLAFNRSKWWALLLNAHRYKYTQHLELCIHWVFFYRKSITISTFITTNLSALCSLMDSH